MELRTHSCALPLLQTISHIKPAICDSGPVRMWSRTKNINYHQILNDPLNEAAAALCESEMTFSNFGDACIVSAATRVNCEQQTKLRLSAECSAKSLCSVHHEAVCVLRYVG